jgi:DNA-binding NtrC family response regulator
LDDRLDRWESGRGAAEPAGAAAAAWKPRVVLAEPDAALRRLQEDCLKGLGLAVVTALSGGQAVAAAAMADVVLVVLSLDLPDVDARLVLSRISREPGAPPTIVTTADASLNAAVCAMRAGAYDYLVKPFSSERLAAAARSALTLDGPTPEARRPATRRRGGAATAGDGRPMLLGTSPAMREVARIIETASRSRATVFVTGESGTGKEVCAQLIHRHSPRGDRPFIAINCGALPHNLVETELFGHVKGAFTGAISDRPGAAIQANGGTLFLDEICEMDLLLQSKLLRFVQEGRVRRVGASSDEKVDVRIICATNRDPLNEVRAGRFREDLFYRLHVIPIALPPLRERGDDAVAIAEALLLDYAREEGKSFRRLAPCAARAIAAYRWPGNVRQLQNVLRNAVVLNDGEDLTLAALPELTQATVAAGSAAAGADTPPPADGAAPVPGPVKPLAQVEQEAIEHAMAVFNNNIPVVAAALGISPSTIYRKRQAWATRHRRTLSGWPASRTVPTG